MIELWQKLEKNFLAEIWISIEKTTDSTGRSVGNVIIRALDGNNSD
jgi:hypothetical protein